MHSLCHSHLLSITTVASNMTMQAPQKQPTHVPLTAPVTAAVGRHDPEPEQVELPFSIADLAPIGSPETRPCPWVRATLCEALELRARAVAYCVRERLP